MQKCPVTILTGFLGSGKTTLLNRILTDPNHGKRIAVLENELSLEIGVEKELVVNSDQMEENFIQVIEFGNGCVCCSSRGDFERILHELSEKRITSHKDGVEAPFDYIIIETTGLADPIFIQSFFQDEHINQNFYLDGIVTLIDAKHAWHHLQDIGSTKKRNEAIQQIVFADRIVINKIDLVESPQQLQKLEETVKQINSVAPITKTTFSNLTVSTILDIKSFDIEKLDPDSKNRVLSTTTSMANTHNANLTTVVILGKGQVDEQQLKNWLEEKTKSYGKQIFRIKGILALKDKEKQYTLQGVHELFSIQEHPSGKVWAPEDEKLTKVVFIGTGLDKEEFNASFKEKLGIDSFWM